jgi:hypothetical protein
VFYQSLDTSTNPATYRLHSVGLDGSNPLVLGTSTTSLFYVMAVADSRLVVWENGRSVNNIAVYDVTQANSRMELLNGQYFLRLVGSRVFGHRPGTIAGTYTVTAVNLDGSTVVTLATNIPPVKTGYNLVYFSTNQMVYTNSAANGQKEGYTVNFDGNGTQQITSGAGDKELMALVGDRLVYQSYATGNTSATRNLSSVRLDGTSVVDYATTAADDRYLGTFNDRVVYTSSVSGTTELRVVPVSGGTSVLLQSSPYSKTFLGAY